MSTIGDEAGADLVEETRETMPGDDKKVAGPSPNPVTNLIMADIGMRAVSYIVRSSVEKGMLRGRYGKQVARDIVNNKTTGQNLASFALAKVATRSVPGALVVGGGIAAKALFDLSRRRRARLSGDKAMIDQATDD